MKILLLNPHIDAEHKIVKAIEAQGHAVLIPGNAEQAWQLLQLHGTSVDIAVIHREGDGPGNSEVGFKLVSKIKNDPTHSDLPFIITSEFWGDHEFVQHQQTAVGANAYLAWPFSEPDLTQLIHAVMGQAAKPVDHVELDIGAPSAPSPLAALNIPQPPQFTQPTINIPGTSPIVPGAQTAPRSFESSPLEISPPSSDVPQLVPSPASSSTGLESNSNIVLESVNFAKERSSQISLNPPEPFGTEPENATKQVPEPPTSITLAQKRKVAAQVELNVTEETGTGRTINIGAEGPEIKWNLGIDDEPKTKMVPEPIANEAQEQVKDVLDLPLDNEAAQEMPYLYEGSGKNPTFPSPPFNLSPPESPPEQSQEQSQPQEHSPQKSGFRDFAYALVQAVGDAVVPGGAAQAPDTETLKKYLLLREQDVAVLSNQLKTIREQLATLDKQLKDEKTKNSELSHTISVQKIRIDSFEQEKEAATGVLQEEINELKFQMKNKAERAKLLESQVRSAAEETEKLKERVRLDIRKIRVREKDLENRLEIMKKDSEALIAARENKIIELKRKMDLIEFNMDLLQDQFMREKENSAKLRDRLARALQVVKVAGGLLESETSKNTSSSPSDDEIPMVDAESGRAKGRAS